MQKTCQAFFFRQQNQRATFRNPLMFALEMKMQKTRMVKYRQTENIFSSAVPTLLQLGGITMKLPNAEAYYFVVGPFCYGVWTDVETAYRKARKFLPSYERKAKADRFKVVAVTEDFLFHDDGHLEGSIVQRLGTMAEWRKL